MALQPCPECSKKISESATICPNCGFSFSKENVQKYQQALENRRLANAEINRKSTKLHLIWLGVFIFVILVMSWWYH